MDNMQRTYDLIEAYLMDRMSVEERGLLESRLESDAGFRQYFEAHRSANQLISSQAEIDIKKQLQHIHLTEGATGSGNRSHFIWGSALLIILGATAWWMLSDNKSAGVDPQNDVHVQLNAENSARESQKMSEGEDAPEKSDSTEDIIEVLAESTGELVQINDKGKEVSPNQPPSPVEEIPSLIPEIVNSSVKGEDPGPIESKKPLNAHENPAELEPPVTLPCEVFDADLELSSTSSCESKKEGAVQVLSSNSSDYASYSLDGNSRDVSGAFANLAPGRYEVRAVDQQGCASLPESIQVEGYDCDFVLYPAQSRYWDIDLDRFDQGAIELVVFDTRSGAMVVTRELSSFEQNQWDGKSDSGQELPMGNYTYILKSDSAHQMGSLTIVR